MRGGASRRIRHRNISWLIHSCFMARGWQYRCLLPTRQAQLGICYRGPWREATLAASRAMKNICVWYYHESQWRQNGCGSRCQYEGTATGFWRYDAEKKCAFNNKSICMINEYCWCKKLLGGTLSERVGGSLRSLQRKRQNSNIINPVFARPQAPRAFLSHRIYCLFS